MKKINQQNKICIYLDQFVVSNFVDETSKLWKEIKKTLEPEFFHPKNGFLRRNPNFWSQKTVSSGDYGTFTPEKAFPLEKSIF